MKNVRSLIVYTISHFAIDFSCFYILIGPFSHSINSVTAVSTGYLLYNVIAFGLQMFIGYLADKTELEHSKIAITGSILVLAGTAVGYWLWAALVLCALGNALFHVGGGINSLVYSQGKMLRCGIFVSSGALGVVLGSFAAKWNISVSLPVILTAICTLGIFLACRQEKESKLPSCHSFRYTSTKINIISSFKLSGGVIIFLCLISIAIRSFVGFEIPVNWKTNTYLSLLPGICAFSGKFAGGLLADRFGGKNIGTGSLFFSIPFICFCNNSITLCCIGFFLFNITMSITLWGVAQQLPDQPGFAFGLTTLALLAGNVPTFFVSVTQSHAAFVLPVLIVISAACILLAIDNNKGGVLYDKESNIDTKELSV